MTDRKAVSRYVKSLLNLAVEQGRVGRSARGHEII